MPDEDTSIHQRLDELRERLDRLERLVEALVTERLESRGRSIRSAPFQRARPPVEPRQPPTTPTPRVVPSVGETAPRETAPRPIRPDPIRRVFEGKGAAYWLSRAGIGLLLLGVAFLFNYAVEQGWLTPTIRVGLGLALGATLVVIGLRVRRERRWFSAIALGGASATFYITGWAAFQLFDLVPYAVALPFMVAVTVYTLWAGWTVDEAALGVLGTLGGLGTPFILYTDSGTVAGLAAYESAVLVGAAGIYLRKGWLSLLWTSVIGGWVVLLVALDALTGQTTGNAADQWVLQLALAVAVMTFWAIPVVREQLASANPQWLKPSGETADRVLGALEETLRDHGLQVLALSTPLAAFYFTMAIWTLPDQAGAALAGVLAAVWGGTWWYLRERRAEARLTSVHVVAGAVLVAIALQHAFHGHTLLVTWMVESVCVLWLARRTGDQMARVSGHVLAAIVALWLGSRLLETGSTTTGSIVDAVVIGLAVAGTLVLGRSELQAYRVAIVAAIAMWLRRELPALPGGDGVVLVGWGILGVIAMRLGRFWKDSAVVAVAHVLFTATALWLANRLLAAPSADPAVINLAAGLNIITLGTALVAARGLTDRDVVTVYGGIVHVLFLGWLWHELVRLPAGHGWVTTSWGVYAVVLLIAGLLKDNAGFRRAALATFGAVVVKLFIVDLAELEPIWRILLFLGFGGAFLALSYYFPNLWKVGSDAGARAKARQEPGRDVPSP